MPQAFSEVRELLPGCLGEGLDWLRRHFGKLLKSERALVAPSISLFQSSHFIYIAPYHNWLVSRTVSPEVVGSNPIGVTNMVA